MAQRKRFLPLIIGLTYDLEYCYIVFLWVVRLLAASYQCREVVRRGQTTGGDMADFGITAGMVGP